MPSSFTAADLLAPVDASAYGARGDSSTDNTAALQAALNAAAVHPTRTLCIPTASGTYNFSTRLTIPTGITVRGQASPGGDTGGYTPWTGNPWKVRLKWTGGYDITLYCPQVSSNAFFDFELDGNSSTGTGIMLGNSARVSATTNGTTTLTNVTRPSALPLIPGMAIDNAWLAGYLDIPDPVTTAVTLTNGSTSATVTGSTTGLASGMVVDGIGIVPDTTMTISGSALTLSKPATASGSKSITFTTAIVSYNAGTGVMVISNATLGSHAADPLNSFFGVYDRAFAGGTNFPHFGGQRAVLDGIYVHDFGVNIGANYLDGTSVTKCNFGNASIANVVMGLIYDTKFAFSYVGGNDAFAFANAYGFYITSTGNGMIIENVQINQIATAIWGSNIAVLANGIAYENAGNPTFPQIDLYNNSVLTGSNFSNSLVKVGTIPIRLDDNSKCFHVCNGLFGHGVDGLTATTHTSTLMDGITDTSVIFVGEVVVGAGIPDNTFVVAVFAHSITLSQAATASATTTFAIFPALIYAVREQNVNVPDIYNLRPIALTDGVNVTSIISNGFSATLQTHGTFGPPLPTSDPHVLNRQWNNAGVVNVSAG